MRISELNFSNLLAAHQWVWGRIIHASELPCGALRSLRVLLPAVYLLLYLPSYNWIAQMPDAWFDPPPLSIAAGFRAFPSLLFFQVAQTLLIPLLAIHSFNCKTFTAWICCSQSYRTTTQQRRLLVFYHKIRLSFTLCIKVIHMVSPPLIRLSILFQHNRLM